jgi:hypothetical protein
MRNGRYFAAIAALGCGWAALFALSGPPQKSAEPAKTEYFKGKVIPLSDLVAKFGSKLDPEATPHWLALEAEDGTIYPLVEDDGARMFFKDIRLLKRPMRLTGRVLPKSQLLQVVAVNSYRDGKLHLVYYWCDVCSIKRFENKQCDCCGGPMQLREEPVTENHGPASQ